MRLIIAVLVYSGFNLSVLYGIEPLSGLAARHVPLISSALALYMLLEALLSVRAAGRRPPAPVKAAEEGARAAVASLEKKDAERLHLLESERDELRERHTRLALKQKETTDQLEALRKKLSDLESRQGAADADRARESAAGTAVLGLLSALQEKGRLIDFLMDDISAYSDGQVGAAARVVHEGCAAALREQLKVAPVFGGREGEQATLPAGFDPHEWRLLGRIQGNPPFSGSVVHRGWKVEKFNLPRPAAENAEKPAAMVIVPAELEVN